MSNIIEGQTSGTVKLRCEITRNYGKQSITLGAEFEVSLGSESDMTRSYNDMYDAVMKQHKLTIERVLSGQAEKFDQPTPPSSKPPQVPNHTERISVDSILVESKGGKRYYKVRGGKWSKFGVYLYPDPKVLESVDSLIDLEELPLGDTVPDIPMFADIIILDGKPTKVYRLVAQTQEAEF